MADGALTGQGVLVTGGGTGIGRACAAALAADGAVVTICGRTESRLLESQAAIQPGHGGRVEVVVADVTDEASVAAAVAAAADHAGNLAGVVANAGGGGGMGPYHVQDTAEFLRVLHLNVLGTMLCVKHAVPHLVAEVDLRRAGALEADDAAQAPGVVADARVDLVDLVRHLDGTLEGAGRMVAARGGHHPWSHVRGPSRAGSRHLVRPGDGSRGRSRRRRGRRRGRAAAAG